MKDSRNKYLIKNTILFTIGSIGTKLISFFLIPLYTHVLTTSQYGTVDLITTIGHVAAPIITLNISESVMRFSLDKHTDRNMNTRIAMFILMCSVLIGTGLIPLFDLFDALADYSLYIYFYIFSLAASQIFLCDLRGKELLLYYSIGNIIQIFTVALLNIVFLVIFHLQIKGYLLAYIIANLLTAFYAIIAGKSYVSYKTYKIDSNQLKRMVQYSAVLIPNNFMWWIMNSSDRIMVTAMISTEANGIYAISYKIPTLISTLTGIFNQAWSYSAIREEGAVDEIDYNNKIFRILTSVTFLIGIFLLTFIKPFLSVYVSEVYYEAWKYTPFLIIGYVYLTLGTFIATSYTVHKDSFGYLFSATFGAVFNIIFNFLV